VIYFEDYKLEFLLEYEQEILNYVTEFGKHVGLLKPRDTVDIRLLKLEKLFENS